MTEVLAGRYELGAELGAGGMARVYEAYDRTLARRVAVKLLHSETLSQPGMRDRFLREARTAASFHHPNAVAVYDTGRDDGVPYIVMELVEGRTLDAVLAEQGALQQDQAKAVASQVLSALAAAHRRGLVHRDVKPANVLLPGGEVPSRPGGEPGVKLADFGIAKGLEEAAAVTTATGQVLGTPKYVSPEQVSGQPATPRSDIYSVGVMLYEMLSGEPPFTGDSALALALAHREDPVPRLSRKVRDLEPGLADVVHRALEKDPADRFADAGEMRAALSDPADAALAAAVPPGPMRTAERGVTQPLPDPDPDADRAPSPWRPIMVVAVLALLALAIAAFDWGGFIDRFTPSPPAEEEPEEEPDPDVDDDGPPPEQPDDEAEDPDPEAEDEPPPDADPDDDPGDGEPPPADEVDPPADDDPPADEDPPPGDDNPPGDEEDGEDGNPSAGQEDDAEAEEETGAVGNEPPSRRAELEASDSSEDG